MKLLIDQNTFSKPWFETDFSIEILNKLKLNKEKKREIKFFIKNGYVIIKNALSKQEIKNIVKDFDKITSSNKFKKNPKYFHYNNSPRIVEGYRQSKNIKKICFNKKINNFF